MLNREKVATQVAGLVAKLFPDLSSEHELAQKKWQALAADDSFAYRAGSAESSFLVPRWEGNLSDTFCIEKKIDEYTAIAVDGSQIYPDRHVSGAGCFLLNTGGVVLSYGAKASADFFSYPNVFVPQDVLALLGDAQFSRDLVDLTREAHELSLLAVKAQEHTNPICFVDGTIIFWPLESKPPAVKNHFLESYLASLERFYHEKTLVAGYISMPRSKELVNLIKLGLCRFAVADCILCHSRYEEFPCKQVDHMIDTQVARFFLEPGHRTTVFYSTSNIVESYPEHLRPAFVYCNVGSEIVRLEFPTWVAQEKGALDHLCAIAFDQSRKGRGYPVCLAEAHEQAVVKGGDRDFFYHLLYKVGMEQNKRLRLSEKAVKKRGIGV